MSEVEVVQVDSKELKRKNIVRIVSVAVLLIFIIVLIVIKVNNPDAVSTGKILLIGGGVLVFGLLVFFSFEIYSKFQKLQDKISEEDKLPPESTEEQIIQRIHEYITNDRYNGFQNHIKSFKSKSYNINKNKIYIFSVELLYEDEEIGKYCFIIVNAHFIKEIPTMLPSNTNESVLFRHVNLLSTNPRDDPDVEESTTYNPITGTEVRHKKVSNFREALKEQNKEVKDIE